MTQMLVPTTQQISRKHGQIIRNVAVAGLTLFLLSACSTTFEKREVNYKPTKVMQPAGEMAENQLLGVRITSFDPGKLPESEDQARGISMEIRKAEGYYIAVQLKNTMQGSGHWGPVRVIPENGREGEVIVGGGIIESDGESLQLLVSVKDASGENWFTKQYGGVVSKEIYEQTESVGIDAFQYLYNQIANDIAMHRQKISSDRVDRIRQIAELKFAADFSSELFSSYLKEGQPEKAREQSDPDLFNKFLALVNSDEQAKETQPKTIYYSVARLPSEDDPMFLRVKRLRAREHLLIDTLDQQYDGLARSLTEPYTQWRVSRLAEMNAIRTREDLRDKKVGQAIAIGIIGALAGAAIGSKNNCNSCAAAGGAIAATSIQIAFQQSVSASEQAEADTKIHKATLEEAGQSLVAEVKPIVVDVEGETVELTGTVEAKFQQWREIIKKIHDREMGPINSAPASTASRPTS